MKDDDQLATDEPEVMVPPAHPSIAIRIFTIFGFVIACSFFGGILFGVLYVAFGNLKSPIHYYLVCWGVAAHFFLWTVKRGIQTNSEGEEFDESVYAEQLYAWRILSRFARFELLISFVALFF
jgi:hypothetical protein